MLPGGGLAHERVSGRGSPRGSMLMFDLARFGLPSGTHRAWRLAALVVGRLTVVCVGQVQVVKFRQAHWNKDCFKSLPFSFFTVTHWKTMDVCGKETGQNSPQNPPHVSPQNSPYRSPRESEWSLWGGASAIAGKQRHCHLSSGSNDLESLRCQVEVIPTGRSGRGEIRSSLKVCAISSPVVADMQPCHHQLSWSCYSFFLGDHMAEL